MTSLMSSSHADRMGTPRRSAGTRQQDAQRWWRLVTSRKVSGSPSATCSPSPLRLALRCSHVASIPFSTCCLPSATISSWPGSAGRHAVSGSAKDQVVAPRQHLEALPIDRFNQSHPVIADRALQYCLIVAGLEKNWCCRVQPRRPAWEDGFDNCSLSGMDALFWIARQRVSCSLATSGPSTAAGAHLPRQLPSSSFLLRPLAASGASLTHAQTLPSCRKRPLAGL